MASIAVKDTTCLSVGINCKSVLWALLMPINHAKPTIMRVEPKLKIDEARESFRYACGCLYARNVMPERKSVAMAIISSFMLFMPLYFSQNNVIKRQNEYSRNILFFKIKLT